LPDSGFGRCPRHRRSISFTSQPSTRSSGCQEGSAATLGSSSGPGPPVGPLAGPFGGGRSKAAESKDSDRSRCVACRENPGIPPHGGYALTGSVRAVRHRSRSRSHGLALESRRRAHRTCRLPFRPENELRVSSRAARGVSAVLTIHGAAICHYRSLVARFLRASVRRHRRAQGGSSTLRSIRPMRAASQAWARIIATSGAVGLESGSRSDCASGIGPTGAAGEGPRRSRIRIAPLPRCELGPLRGSGPLGGLLTPQEVSSCIADHMAGDPGRQSTGTHPSRQDLFTPEISGCYLTGRRVR
jgi:hypothetical protein